MRNVDVPMQTETIPQTGLLCTNKNHQTQTDVQDNFRPLIQLSPLLIAFDVFIRVLLDV